MHAHARTVLFSFAVAFAGVVLCPAASEAQVMTVKRPTLMVRDLETSLRVYRDVLGFEVFAINGDKESKPETGKELSLAYTYFSIDPKRYNYTRFATLSTPTQTRAFGLIEVRGAKLAQPTPRVSTVVLEVKDVFETAKQLKKLGLRIFPKSESTTPEGVKFVELPFEDPDGHIIVLYHLDKSGVQTPAPSATPPPASPKR